MMIVLPASPTIIRSSGFAGDHVSACTSTDGRQGNAEDGKVIIA